MSSINTASYVFPKTSAHLVEISQHLHVQHVDIVKQLNRYSKLRSPDTSIDLNKGVCSGMVSLYAYYHFIGKREEYFNRLYDCLNTEILLEKKLHKKTFSELSKKEQELECLLNDIIFFHKRQKNLIITLSTPEAFCLVSNDPKVHNLCTPIKITSKFQFDKKTRSFKSLVNILKEILKTAPQSSKFIAIGGNHHSVGLYYQEGYFSYYDNNFPKSEIISPINGNLERKLRLIIAFYASVYCKISDRDASIKSSMILTIEIVSQTNSDPSQYATIKDSLHTNLKNEINDVDLLIEASRSGSLSTVKFLVKNGADFNAANNDGITPLHEACLKRRHDIVAALLKEGVKIDPKDNKRVTPLWIACFHGQTNTVKLLLDKGANIEAEDDNGLTPLHMACCQANEDTVAALLKEGANIEAKDHSGKTPLCIASLEGHYNIVTALLKKGANSEAKDNKGYTPHLIACEAGHYDVVKALSDKRAKAAQEIK